MHNPLTWASNHPFKACLYSSILTAIAVFTGCNPHLFKYGATLFIITVFINMIHAYRESQTDVLHTAIRKVVKNSVRLSIIVAMSSALVAKPAEPQPQVLPYVVGGCVLVGGGYCVYKIIRFCQQKFPKSNTDTNSLSLTLNGGDDYGMSWANSSLGSCFVPDFRASSTPPSLSLFDIEAEFIDGELTISSLHRRGEESMQAFGGWQSDLASVGLWTEGRSGERYYSLRGVPCDASLIPVRAMEDGTITFNDRQTRTVKVEKSFDLLEWSSVATFQVPDGLKVKITDLSASEHAFYRLIKL